MTLAPTPTALRRIILRTRIKNQNRPDTIIRLLECGHRLLQPDGGQAAVADRAQCVECRWLLDAGKPAPLLSAEEQELAMAPQCCVCGHVCFRCTSCLTKMRPGDEHCASCDWDVLTRSKSSETS